MEQGPSLLTKVPWLLAAAGGVYLLLLGVVYLLQEHLLYAPTRMSWPQTLEAAAGLGLRPWPDEARYFGLAGPPPAAPRGTVLLWHGNAGTALDRMHYLEPLRRLGYQVVLLEYPGYGPRPGRPGERPLVADALRATRAALKEFQGPFFAWGESLGSGVAAHMAGALGNEFAGVVLITPWNRLPELAQCHYPFLPAKWLVRDRYDNLANLQDFPGPIAILVAGEDDVIPPRHARRLYDGLPGPKRLWQFPQAGHNSWPSAPEAAWWEEVARFLESGRED